MSVTESIDTLLTLAEIGAAFAGFSALVSVLKVRRGRADAIHDILRLRIVISTSVVAVVASLIPIGLTNFDIADRIVWSVSAATLLTLDYSVIVSFVRSYKPARGQFPPDRAAVILFGALEVLEQAALIVIILSVRPDSNRPLYIAALILNICQAALVFVRYVGSEFSVQNNLPPDSTKP